MLGISRINKYLQQRGSQYFPKDQNTLLDSISKIIFPQYVKLKQCKTVVFSNMTNWVAPFCVCLQRISHNSWDYNSRVEVIIFLQFLFLSLFILIIVPFFSSKILKDIISLFLNTSEKYHSLCSVKLRCSCLCITSIHDVLKPLTD